MGVFWTVELVSDRETKTPVDAATIAAIKGRCQDAGVLVFPAANRIHMVPPCTVTPGEVARAVSALDEAIGSVG